MEAVTYTPRRVAQIFESAENDNDLLVALYRISNAPPYVGIFDDPINELETKLKLSLIAIEGLKLKAKFQFIEDLTATHVKPFQDMTYEQIVDLSTAYYRQIRKDNKVFPGMAIKMCIDKFGVEPQWR